jgi:hypothetical protein
LSLLPDYAVILSVLFHMLYMFAGHDGVGRQGARG